MLLIFAVVGSVSVLTTASTHEIADGEITEVFPGRQQFRGRDHYRRVVFRTQSGESITFVDDYAVHDEDVSSKQVVVRYRRDKPQLAEIHTPGFDEIVLIVLWLMTAVYGALLISQIRQRRAFRSLTPKA
jgi:hypothetical protein